MVLVSWNVVRAIGELQILTRVSYMVLGITPLLVAFWPLISKSFDTAEIRAEQLTTLDAREVLENLQSGDPTAQQVGSDSKEEHSNHERPLPWIFVSGFFAALSVTLGQLTYQVFVPGIVARRSQSEYVTYKSRLYFDNPTEEFVSESLGIIVGEQSKAPFAHECNISGEIEKISKLFLDKKTSQIDQLIQSLEPAKRLLLLRAADCDPELFPPILRKHIFSNLVFLSGLSKEVFEVQRKVGIVRRGAEIEHFEASESNKIACLVTEFFYSIGITLILSILYFQSLRILKAGSIEGLFDLISP